MSRKHILTESRLGRLTDLLAAIDEARASDHDWRARTSVHFLRNYTTEPIDPYLTFHLLRDDVDAAITHGGYGTLGQELLDEASPLIADPPDVIVLSLLIEYLDPAIADNGWTADVAIAEIVTMVGLLLDRTDAFVALNSFIAPVDTLIDTSGVDVAAERERLNAAVLELVAAHPDRLAVCDWGELLTDGDAARSIDKRFWESSEAPFKSAFLDGYARQIAGVVRAVNGLTKKCLILDCDDTLWGGVVGEDGVDGILLDTESGPGCAFRRFQKQAVELQEQGVMLALCSKNNEADVWEVLDNHPHAVLGRSNLVAWRINWDDKASNIASLLDELNIGADSVVFVDDSARELALIADRLPDVTLLAVPENLSDYPTLLTRDGLFVSVTASSEDRDRTRMYQEQSERRGSEQRFADLSEYLRSLQTTVRIEALDDANVPRAVQLTQKTNQFNLTTRRYTEDELRAFADATDSAVFTMTVSDRFGDLGLTGVFIARLVGDDAIIDTLLLSCRILGRRLEMAFVDQCMQALEDRWAIGKWRAAYIPTRKNRQTEGFWDSLGFMRVGEDENGKQYSSGVGPRDRDYLDVMTVESE